MILAPPPEGSIAFAFYKGTDSLNGWLVKLLTASDKSHAVVWFSDGKMLDSASDRKTALFHNGGINEAKWDVVYFRLPAGAAREARRAAEELVLHDGDAKGRLLCSQAAAFVAQRAGLLPSYVDPRAFAPVNLLEALTA